jgi:hypothetical protein
MAKAPKISVWALVLPILFILVLAILGGRNFASLLFLTGLFLPFVLGKARGWTPSETFLMDPDLAMAEKKDD